MFHWLPYMDGGAPYRYILFAMEPSATGVRDDGVYPQEGGFHQGLLFAIRKYLLSDPERETFLITNMAKCTIRGDLCKRTRGFRWRKCSDFLKAEIRLAEGPPTEFIAIGREQQLFLLGKGLAEAIRGRTVYYLTHYSPRNSNNFKEFAHQRSEEFGAFCETTAGEFTRFLCDNNADYELRQLGQERETSLARLFKWQAEMRAVRQHAREGD